MPPPRRRRQRPRSAAAAAAAAAEARGNGWLSVRRHEPFKRREARGGGGAATEDDGLPLNDEALITIFSCLSDSTADLVRCAATCRRWRRLFSTDAAFICHRAPPRSDHTIRSLAIGFFLQRDDGHEPSAPPRFVPLPSSAPRLFHPSLVDDGDDGLLDSARVVACRNGRLVLDLRRTKSAHVVNLCVGDPMTGDVHVLPPLRGKDTPGAYACTVITAADDLDHCFVDHHRVSSSTKHSSYRVLLVYNRRSFTALRCYSSDERTWGPEAEVIGARIGRKQQLTGKLHASLVHNGVVLWPRLALALQLDTLTLHPSPPPAQKKKGKPPARYTVNGFSTRRHLSWAYAGERLVGAMPDGRLLRVEADSETMRAYCGGNGNAGGRCTADAIGRSLVALAWKWTLKLALVSLHAVKLRWLCEKSGVVFFTARNGSDPGTHVYAVDVEKEEVYKVATLAAGEALGEMCGYEMDRAALLASFHES